MRLHRARFNLTRMTTAPLPPKDMLCFALYSAAHAMQSAYAPLLDPLGLTYPQFLVISALHGAPDMTVGQLGAVLLLDTNTLTPLLKRMEKAGWLTRLRDPADERQVRLALTPSGQDMAAKLGAVSACFGAKSGLSVQAITTLRDDLTALRDQLRPRPAKAGSASQSGPQII